VAVSFRLVDATHGRPAPDVWLSQAAGILNSCFPEEHGYPTPERAAQEVAHLRVSAAILLLAIEPQESRGMSGGVIGLIAALPAYRGRVWELHPLAVRLDRQNRGIGRILVAALEERARRAGVGTITLGTDDLDQRTSLGGKDIFPGVLSWASRLTDVGGHPFSFYEKLGYEVVGVIPDANGFGKPDILMAKRIGGPR
jgi:aminoglycoside 6'-N-acetyltransferase I